MNSNCGPQKSWWAQKPSFQNLHISLYLYYKRQKTSLHFHQKGEQYLNFRQKESDISIFAKKTKQTIKEEKTMTSKRPLYLPQCSASMTMTSSLIYFFKQERKHVIIRSQWYNICFSVASFDLIRISWI